MTWWCKISSDYRKQPILVVECFTVKVISEPDIEESQILYEYLLSYILSMIPLVTVKTYGSFTKVIHTLCTGSSQISSNILLEPPLLSKINLCGKPAYGPGQTNLMLDALVFSSWQTPLHSIITYSSVKK